MFVFQICLIGLLCLQEEQMKIRPLFDRVVVKPEENKTTITTVMDPDPLQTICKRFPK